MHVLLSPQQLQEQLPQQNEQQQDLSNLPNQLIN